MLRKADWVSAVSKAMLDDVHQVLPEIAHRSSIIYNSLSMPAVRPEPLPFDAPRLLCIGRVVVDKGFDLALRAFASIAQSFPRCRMIIAGNGPAMSDLRKCAAELGLKDSVEFTGWVESEEIPRLINKATVVVIPSRRHESFGLVALQAAQMARPVVATHIGGLPEVVAHGETGLLVENENSEALSTAIASLLANPDIAIRMGRSAQLRAEKLFSWDHCVDAYDTLYRQISKKRIVLKSTSTAR
jgi:glycogen(starch) synthase